MCWRHWTIKKQTGVNSKLNVGTFIQKYISEKYNYFYPVMCASLRPFQNCLQIDSSVNIKAVMMILVHIYALLWPYTGFVPKKEKSKQNVIS